MSVGASHGLYFVGVSLRVFVCLGSCCSCVSYFILLHCSSCWDRAFCFSPCALIFNGLARLRSTLAHYFFLVSHAGLVPFFPYFFSFSSHAWVSSPYFRFFLGLLSGTVCAEGFIVKTTKRRQHTQSKVREASDRQRDTQETCAQMS